MIPLFKSMKTSFESMKTTFESMKMLFKSMKAFDEKTLMEMKRY